MVSYPIPIKRVDQCSQDPPPRMPRDDGGVIQLENRPPLHQNTNLPHPKVVDVSDMSKVNPALIHSHRFLNLKIPFMGGWIGGRFVTECASTAK